MRLMISLTFKTNAQMRCLSLDLTYCRISSINSIYVLLLRYVRNVCFIVTAPLYISEVYIHK